MRDEYICGVIFEIANEIITILNKHNFILLGFISESVRIGYFKISYEPKNAAPRDIINLAYDAQPEGDLGEEDEQCMATLLIYDYCFTKLPGHIFSKPEIPMRADIIALIMNTVNEEQANVLEDFTPKALPKKTTGGRI